jgi:putative Mn2+ efflux pump MntP
MLSLEIFLLGLALAIDAAVVTFAIGILHQEFSLSEKLRSALLCSFIFGFFQFLMLFSGSYAGYLFTFSQYGHLLQVSVPMIFLLLGIKLVQEALGLETKKLQWGFFSILLLAVVTSLDALASGMSLGTVPHAQLASLIVGLVTFFTCFAFYLVSQFFSRIPERALLFFGALIFFFLSGQSFWKIRTLFFKAGL